MWYDKLQKQIAEIGGTVLFIFLVIKIIIDVYTDDQSFSLSIYLTLFIISFLLIGWNRMARLFMEIKKVK